METILDKLAEHAWQRSQAAKQAVSAADMKKMAHGLYEASRYSYYHNQKKNMEGTKCVHW